MGLRATTVNRNYKNARERELRERRFGGWWWWWGYIFPCRGPETAVWSLGQRGTTVVTLFYNGGRGFTKISLETTPSRGYRLVPYGSRSGALEHLPPEVSTFYILAI